MGTKCAPYYATLTLAYLEANIMAPKIQNKFGMEVSNYFGSNFYRYLDDCFIIWPKSYPSFSKILSILNQAHPSIKFTSSISEKQIPFLDVLIILTEHNTIITDIYRKPTDSQNYLHFHSSHPSHTKRNIPYTLSRRICTIVSEPTTKNLRLHEMKSILISKKYPIKLIDNAIEKALNIPQNILRIPKQQRNQQEISLTLTFNPNNPIVTNSMNYFFQMLKTNNQTKDIFQNSTLRICKRQPPDLKKLLTKATIHPKHSQFHNSSVKKCNRNRCKCCEEIIEGNFFFFSKVNKNFFVRQNMDCLTKFVVYTLICNNCKNYYIGLTSNSLCSRVTLHRQHINNPSLAPLSVSKHIATCSKDLSSKFSIFPIYHVSKHCLTTLRRMENVTLHIKH